MENDQPIFQPIKNSDLVCSDCIFRAKHDLSVAGCAIYDLKPSSVLNGGECAKHMTLDEALVLYGDNEDDTSTAIKNLMFSAIAEERPPEVAEKCLSIWNQPFFYQIDKARALTVSYAPTDKGAKKNYTELYDAYKAGDIEMTPEQIYRLLYNFKEEHYWRKNFNKIFAALGIEKTEIAHIDMSSFPYSKDIYRKECVSKGLDKNHKYALEAINILSEQLKYIMIDGKDNYEIIEKYLLDDYFLVDKKTVQVNKKNKTQVHFYAHNTKEQYLIYVGTFLYGMTCVSNACIDEIIEFAKLNSGM